MADQFITVTEDDLQAPIYIMIHRNYDLKASDLSDSNTSIKLKFRAQNSTTTNFDATLTKVWGDLGVLKLDWPDDSLDVTPGTFEAQVRTIDGNSEVQTVLDKIIVTVEAKFAAA